MMNVELTDTKHKQEVTKVSINSHTKDTQSSASADRQEQRPKRDWLIDYGCEKISNCKQNLKMLSNSSTTRLFMRVVGMGLSSFLLMRVWRWLRL